MRRWHMMVQAVVSLVMLPMSVAMAVADAAAVVDVYRVIQFDLQNAFMGSRLTALNHHATSGLVVLGAVCLPSCHMNFASPNVEIDSNGSDVAMFLELAGLFPRLYANPIHKWLRNFDQRLR